MWTERVDRVSDLLWILSGSLIVESADWPKKSVVTEKESAAKLTESTVSVKESAPTLEESADLVKLSFVPVIRSAVEVAPLFPELRQIFF